MIKIIALSITCPSLAFADNNSSSNTQAPSTQASQESSDDSESSISPDPKNATSSSALKENNSASSKSDDSKTGEDEDSTDNEEDIPDPDKPTKAGWFKDSKGNTYYYKDINAKPLTGWQKISGKWYYLDPLYEMPVSWRRLMGMVL